MQVYFFFPTKKQKNILLIIYQKYLINENFGHMSTFNYSNRLRFID